MGGEEGWGAEGGEGGRAEEEEEEGEEEEEEEGRGGGGGKSCKIHHANIEHKPLSPKVGFKDCSSSLHVFFIPSSETAFSLLFRLLFLRSHFSISLPLQSLSPRTSIFSPSVQEAPASPSHAFFKSGVEDLVVATMVAMADLRRCFFAGGGGGRWNSDHSS